MKVRQIVNRYRRTTIAIVALLIAASTTVAFVTLEKSGGGIGERVQRHYFATDDSSPERALASLVEDDACKISPVQIRGKPAYRAYVFSPDNGRTRFVAYLERVPEPYRSKLEPYCVPNPTPEQIAKREELMTRHAEIKKPGTAAWVPLGDDKASASVLNVVLPEGFPQGPLGAVFP